jgi:hypothetical protein
MQNPLFNKRPMEYYHKEICDAVLDSDPNAEIIDTGTYGLEIQDDEVDREFDAVVIKNKIQKPDLQKSHTDCIRKVVQKPSLSLRTGN